MRICSWPVPASIAVVDRCRRSSQVPGRINFLGFIAICRRLLAAADVLVHPARYEAYGLAVHEALCRDIPAIVSREAGVAERFPAALEPLLLDDPDSVDELRTRS